MANQLPSRVRFTAPGSSQQWGRSRAPGLGGEAEEPATDQPFAGVPQSGFTGYLGRSRFASPPPAPVLAHGVTVEGASSGPGEIRDPSEGMTVFESQDALNDAGGVDTRTRTSDTGGGPYNHMLARGFVRRYVDTTNPGRKPADMIRWGEAPIPRAFRQLRYTLRREYAQDAQTFRGEHTSMIKAGKGSTSPMRMGPARTNRLTNRAPTGSYGQITEVLGG